MEKAYIAKRLKKYLFFISIIFVVLSSAHLIYSYIFSDAKETAIKGGSISEAIIGSIPSLNPLKNNSEQNKYINSILYRSLLKYDVSKKQIIGDLAKCDISNLLQVECFLNTNIKWSNAENITKTDVIKTFETLKGDNINPIMFSLLKNTTITETDTSIIFKNTKKDINFLKIFFQPIVSEKVLNIISKKELEGNFGLQNGIYSGKYRVVNITKDESVGISTITLEKNEEFYKNPVYIETIFLKIFPTVKDFLKNKNSINIFNDKDNLLSGTIPRLQEYSYILPQYVSVFFNTQKITDDNLRALISREINNEEIIKKLGEKKFNIVHNPFISEEIAAEQKIETDLEEIMRKKGYFTYDTILEKLNSELSELGNGKNIISGEVIPKIISGEVTIEETVGDEEKKLKSESEEGDDAPKFTIEKIENTKSKIIISPNWVDMYNFISKSDTLLKGSVVAGTTEVHINEDKLQGFSSGDTEFFYRISTARGTLKQGQNNYKIYFTINNEKKLIEEVNFYYSNDKALLKTKEIEVLEKKIPIVPEVKEKEVIQTIVQQPLSESQIEENKKSSEYIQLEEKIKKVEALEKTYLYNEELETYVLELYFISGKADYEQTAEYIKEVLEKKGFDVQLREITTQNLNNLLVEGKKNYDMLLAGVNLSYFSFNIYPYFHSSQIENGYNFSNFRKLDLDIILEDLKSKILGEEKIKELEKKALDIINGNHLVKTIYTPVLSNLVDKNIKGYSLETYIPENIYRFDPLVKSYVNEDRFIITENKDVSGYIKYIIDILF